MIIYKVNACFWWFVRCKGRNSEEIFFSTALKNSFFFRTWQNMSQKGLAVPHSEPAEHSAWVGVLLTSIWL